MKMTLKITIASLLSAFSLSSQAADFKLYCNLADGTRLQGQLIAGRTDSAMLETRISGVGIGVLANVKSGNGIHISYTDKEGLGMITTEGSSLNYQYQNVIGDVNISIKCSLVGAPPPPVPAR